MKDKPRELRWTPQLVQRFWDYQSRFPGNYFTNQFGAEIALSLAPLLRGHARVLDYGCGMGFLIPHLARYATEVAGADVSGESLQKVNKICGGISNFLGAWSVEELMASSRKFDAIVAVEVIEHLYDDQLDKMLHDVGRLLNPGGIAIITTPNEEDLSLNEIYCPEGDSVFHRWQHVRRFDTELLRSFMEKRGLSTQKVFTTDFAARGLNQRLKAALRPYVGRKNPHLVYVGRKER